MDEFCKKWGWYIPPAKWDEFLLDLKRIEKLPQFVFSVPRSANSDNDDLG